MDRKTVLTSNDLLLIALVAPVVLALLAPLSERVFHLWSARLLALGVAAVFALFLRYLPGVMDGEVYEASWSWVPGLDLAIALRLDGLSLLFALLITGIGALVLLYGGDYLYAAAPRGRFFLFLLLFMASMLGIVLSDNLVLVFVFWELTSITSFMLIGFEHGKSSARGAAQQALIVTGMGGLALLAGLLLLGIAGGSWEISALAEEGAIDPGSGLVMAAFWCIFVGAITKSAQFPFHGWLPGAMAAPTPVSAYLHSATMVKAGIFLLARMHPVLGDVAAWEWALPAVGGATMLITAVIAIHETDLKRVLAYSTVSALGTIVFLIGIGTEEALTGAIVFILAHALYKAALFMVAGSVDHQTGTRDRTLLGGLRHAMPLTAAAAVLAAISMAGLPPTEGFLAKETLFEVTTHGSLAVILSVAAAAVGSLTFVAAGLVSLRPFFGERKQPPREPHEGKPGLWAPPLLLAVLGITAGVLSPLVGGVLSPAVSATAGSDVEVHLSLWHGVNLVLILSAIAIAIGVLALWRLELVQRLLPLPPFTADQGFNGALAGMNRLALAQTRMIQNGSLRRYIAIVLAMAVLAGLGVLLARGEASMPEFTAAGAEVYAVAVLLIITALTAALSSSRLYSVAATGAVGFGIALLFAIFSAPDVAMTQVLVDTLIVVLFVSVFRHLPTSMRIQSRRSVRLQVAGVAILVGVAATILTWTVMTVPRSDELSRYYVESSVPEAHGRNVVNTILVDFRAMDTLGEITVLSMAALGIVAVLRLRPDDDEDVGDRS